MNTLGKVFDDVTWNIGHSSLSYYDLFNSPKPGQNYEPIPNIPDKTNYRLYRLARKYDLANYYRYNKTMLKNKQGVIKLLLQSVLSFRKVFAIYGNKVRFKAEVDDIGECIITKEFVDDMEDLAFKLLDDYMYILEASRMMSPYTGVSAGPISMKGCYKPLNLEGKPIKWLNLEPSLKKFRNHFDDKGPYEFEESFLISGIVSPFILEGLVRLCLKKRRDKVNSKPVRYKYTKTMTDVLNLERKYCKNTKMKKFIYSMFNRDVDIENLKPPFDPEDLVHLQYLDETIFILDFLDAEDQISRNKKPSTKRRAPYLYKH